ncbi:MAG: hypothetical protein AAFV95_11030 [Bacteroidota bacterium]
MAKSLSLSSDAKTVYVISDPSQAPGCCHANSQHGVNITFSNGELTVVEASADLPFAIGSLDSPVQIACRGDESSFYFAIIGELDEINYRSSDEDGPVTVNILYDEVAGTMTLSSSVDPSGPTV